MKAGVTHKRMTWKNPFLEGEKIYLRPLEPEDLNQEYLGWLNDPKVTCFLESGIFPQTLKELEIYNKQANRSPNQLILAIIDKKSSQHVGNVKLGPIHWIHRRGTLGLLIGNPQHWGKGIGGEATRLMLGYAFSRLNLNRIDLGVYANHKRAIHLYHTIGFRIEGRFRRDVFHEGQYKDRLWMGLLRSEFGKTPKKKMK
jgi:[ribosomal protein S5]-alanine N-acetyltransferase